MSYTHLVKWTRWFAWYPVRLQIDNSRVWLCWVEYQQFYFPGAYGGAGDMVTHYRIQR